MTEEEKKIEEKEIHNVKAPRIGEKIKNWLKNPYNLSLLGIFLFAFIIRFYYFFITRDQPLWFDEGVYMSSAKSYAGIMDFQLESIRLPGYPLLMSAFFILGINNEVVIRFIALFIPSLIVIFLTYLCIKEMYKDRRVALISTAIITVLWEHVFYSNRFHTENFALIFQFLAFYLLFKVYLKKEEAFFIKPKYSLLIIALLSIISVIFRPGNMPFIPAIILFVLWINKSHLLNKKYLISIVSLGVAAVLAFIFSERLQTLVSFYVNTQRPLAWSNLTVFHGFYQSVIPWLPSILFYFIIIGLILVLVDFFINKKKLMHCKVDKEDLELKADLFNFLLMISVFIIFIFLIRAQSFEYRWFFPLLTAMLVFTSKGIITTSNYIGYFLKNKKIVVLLILLVLGLGMYNQVLHADGITKMKIDSYAPVRDSGVWMKEHSSPEDTIVTASITQHAYYAERKVYDFYVNGSNENETKFNEEINENKPKYLVISSFEPGFTPQWAYDWPQRHNESAIPVQAFFADQEQKQPLLIIYELKWD
ncbi:ArnT family glycosyltransferase [Nanoarchaeota archaeon]